MADSLVCLIIQEEFGDKFAQVFDVLLKHGELPLQEIKQKSGLDFQDLKHIMIILIKNNLIYFINKAQNPQPDTPEQLVYKISISETLQRLR